MRDSQQSLKLEDNEASNSDEISKEDINELEMHDFRAPDLQAEQDNKQLIRPLTIIAAGKRNKVVPIMEVPSSESENSSKR